MVTELYEGSLEIRRQAEDMGLSPEDIEFLVSQGRLSPDDIALQVAHLGRDRLSLDLARPCTLGDGILALSEAERNGLDARFREYAGAKTVMRFIPASGAASRLFAAWDWYLHQDPSPTRTELKTLAGSESQAKACLAFLEKIDSFPFAGEALDHLNRTRGENLSSLSQWVDKFGPQPVLSVLLEAAGLGLREKPKALIPFHRYADGVKTALDEQMAETAALVLNPQGMGQVHFTVAPEHRATIMAAGEQAAEEFDSQGKKIAITYSEQDDATRTLSLSDGRLARDGEGRPALRPGGHGALLENLSAVGEELVFIKNIDNVVRREELASSLRWRGALAGLLLECREEIHAHLRKLHGSDPEKAVEAASHYLEEKFGLSLPDTLRRAGIEDRLGFCREKLNRPVRVCGMVKNQGEPGGGPFWVRQKDGGLSLQIVEAAQVDLENADQKALLAKATHFNPVDFVCGLTDWRGKPFALRDFADENAWFLSEKNKDGKTLKVLERPGLWNGAMAHWLTLFVEIPLELFNPVKTIGDLLRPSHLG